VRAKEWPDLKSCTRDATSCGLGGFALAGGGGKGEKSIFRPRLPDSSRPKGFFSLILPAPQGTRHVPRQASLHHPTRSFKRASSKILSARPLCRTIRRDSGRGSPMRTRGPSQKKSAKMTAGQMRLHAALGQLGIDCWAQRRGRHSWAQSLDPGEWDIRTWRKLIMAKSPLKRRDAP